MKKMAVEIGLLAIKGEESRIYKAWSQQVWEDQLRWKVGYSYLTIIYFARNKPHACKSRIYGIIWQLLGGSHFCWKHFEPARWNASSERKYRVVYKRTHLVLTARNHKLIINCWELYPPKHVDFTLRIQALFTPPSHQQTNFYVHFYQISWPAANK